MLGSKSGIINEIMHESGGIGDRAVKGEEVGQRTSQRGTRDPLQKSSRAVFGLGRDGL